MEIEQTARQLETNAHANFPMAVNVAYQCMENGHIFGSLCVSGTMLRQSEGPRRVSREYTECFLSTVRHTNA